MKVLIDTNILISAALNPSGTPYAAFEKAVTYPNRGVICEQNIDELRRIFNRKFPNRILVIQIGFFSLLFMSLQRYAGSYHATAFLHEESVFSDISLYTALGIVT